MRVDSTRASLLLAAILASNVLAGSAQACGLLPGTGTNGSMLQGASYIVKFKDEGSTQARSTRASQFAMAAYGMGVDARPVRRMADKAEIFRMNGRDRSAVALAASRLAQRPDVEYVVEDRLASILSIPNDTHFSEQWALHSPSAGINAPAAWSTSTGEGIIIAILDSGITHHPDLAPNVLNYGYDFVSDVTLSKDGDGRDPDPTDPGDANTGSCGGLGVSSWHGTQVAGIAAAVANNNLGISGTAPSAKILPVRVLGAGGSGNLSDIADAIRWAAGGTVPGVPTLLPGQTADVINLSLGWSVPYEPGVLACSPVEQSAIDFAIQQGVVVVAAAGNNNGTSNQISPASCTGVINVAASDINRERAIYSGTGLGSVASNRGAGIDVTAPGKANISTDNSGSDGVGAPTYGAFSGTSAAAPHVAGVVALIQSVSPKSPQEILQILTSTDGAQLTCSGCAIPGPINAGAAVAAAVQSAPAAPVAMFSPERISASCPSQKSNYAMNNTSSNPQGGPLTSTWVLGNGYTSTAWNPSGKSTDYYGQIAHITLTVTNQHNVSSSKTVVVDTGFGCTQ